uniref:F-box domain-containing protein n=1 Tax=Oryza meridionalis TaxID=40149 RepID=A0A0E0CIT6_9ORYZ
MTSVSDLPPELVCLIGRPLHTAIDVVRFHAICSDWRQSLRYIPPSPPPAAALLPWLLAPSSGDDDDAGGGVACRCVFSKTSYHAPGLCFRDRRVAHADGTASWFINDKLVNTLTGWTNVGRVKKYPWMWTDGSKGFFHCVVSGDGSLLVYRLSPRGFGIGITRRRRLGVAFHGGATVSVDLANCYIHKEPLFWLLRTPMPLPDEPGKVRRRSYLLELRGELLLASVLQDDDDDDRLSVSVHAFDVDAALYALDPDAVEPPAAAAAPPSPVWEKRDDSDF